MGGGVAGARSLVSAVQAAKAEQRQLSRDIAMRRGAPTRKVAVDGVFLRRLGTILRM